MLSGLAIFQSGIDFNFPLTSSLVIIIIFTKTFFSVEK